MLSFGGFYLYKMCMMMKLHTNIQIPRLTLGFHFGGKFVCNHAVHDIKINDPEICHFLNVLHDQCVPLDFGYT